MVKPEVLQKATVELLDQALCAGLYGPSLTDRMVCAGYLDGKVDSCQVSSQVLPIPFPGKSVRGQELVWRPPVDGPVGSHCQPGGDERPWCWLSPGNTLPNSSSACPRR